ncbi:MAG: AmmeMemoRadiSam system protein B [Planctomycetaceae bacterium]|nr:AmmeMemoRadiSam system protein B [Planctomycetaceae bacterium]
MDRAAEKAGSWYERDNEGLRVQVEECLADARDRYGRAVAEAAGRPVGIVVPHAGLVFSGAVAAAAFDLVRQRLERVDTFVVFGACHRARLSVPAIWATGQWDTPFGPAQVDAPLAQAFVDAGVGREDYGVHQGDNAIELQMPFIKAMFPDAQIVPIAMGFFPDAGDIGKRAAEAAQGCAGTIVAVASTDLTHYGASFGIMPAGTGEPALCWLAENDGRFLDAAVGMDARRVVEVAERDHSACGAGAVAAVIGWASAFGAASGRLLAYTNSHDVMPQGEASHMVGYGAVAYEADVP